MQPMKEQDWLAAIRSEGMQKFQQFPMHQEREEDWRYTDLNLFQIKPHAGDSEVALEGGADGVIFTDLMSATMNHAEALKKHLGKAVVISDKFSAFHYANISNGVLIVVPDNKTAR